MLVTVFLSVLILALAMGNIFLSLTGTKRLEKVGQEGNGQLVFDNGFVQSDVQDSFSEALPDADNGNSISFDKAENGGAGNSLSFGQAKGKSSAPSFQQADSGAGKGPSFEQAAAGEKMAYLNKRLERLEQLLLKIDNSKFLAQKLNSTSLSKKLSGLDEFKQNTRLEIAALKQRLDKVQPVKKAKKPKVQDISDKKLRELVFRSSR